MSSWRDSVSEQTATEMDKLMDYILPAAHDLLMANGTFFPIGAVTPIDGEPRALAVLPDENNPDAQQVLNDLLDAFRSEKDDIRSCATACDVLLGNGEAILVELEHRDGIAIRVIHTYERHNDTILLADDLAAEQGQPRIWA
jgi:hypothetical protein